MTKFQTLPDLWLLSDARNDAALEGALMALPKASALVFRHYHMPEAARRARYEALIPLVRSGSHMLILSGPSLTAREWSADGIYGPPELLEGADDLLKIATVHNETELEAAIKARANAVMISPVFATNSHKGAAQLGVEAYNSLARKAEAANIAAIALGGMTHERARELGIQKWAAIDGLS